MNEGEEQQRTYLRSLIFSLASGLALALQHYVGDLSWVSAPTAIAFVAGSSLLIGAIAEGSVQRAPTARQELAASAGLALLGGSVVATALTVHSWSWMLAGLLTLANAFVHGPPASEPRHEPARESPYHLDREALDEDELAEYGAEQATLAELERRDDERRERVTQKRDEFPHG